MKQDKFSKFLQIIAEFPARMLDKATRKRKSLKRHRRNHTVVLHDHMGLKLCYDCHKLMELGY
jgi:hypothetical protein